MHPYVQRNHSSNFRPFEELELNKCIKIAKYLNLVFGIFSKNTIGYKFKKKTLNVRVLRTN